MSWCASPGLSNISNQRYIDHMTAKRVCPICGQPVVMKHPGPLWFHTDLETGTTYSWHMTCKLKEIKR